MVAGFVNCPQPAMSTANPPYMVIAMFGAVEVRCASKDCPIISGERAKQTIAICHDRGLQYHRVASVPLFSVRAGLNRRRQAMNSNLPLPPVDNDPAVRDLTDEELLGSFVNAHDRGSFEILVRRYQHEIYNYLRRYLRDDSLAEDAFQLTFVRVYQKADQFDLTRRFRPWLYGVATNQAIDLKRRIKRRVHQSLDVSASNADSRSTSRAASIPDHRQPTSDPLVDQEFSNQMREAVDRLGEPGRSALELIYLQGLPYKEAAEILDVPVGTVKSRVHAAIRKLAASWQRIEQ